MFTAPFRLAATLTVGLTVLAAAPLCAADADVAFGSKHGVALRTNGEVLTWGENVYCQLGRASRGNVDPTPGVALRNAVAIAAAAEHTLALTGDGKVYGWGMNPEGALGTGDTYDKCEGPVLIQSLAPHTIVGIATGNGFSMAVSNKGELFCTGDNSVQQCAAGRTGRLTSFTAVPLAEIAGAVTAIKAGAFHTLARLKDGSLFAIGRGREGQLGLGTVTNGWGRVAGVSGVVSFSAGTWHSVAATADGRAWTWGANQKSQLCDGGTTNRPQAAVVAGLPGTVTQVAGGGHSTLFKGADGVTLACGDNQFSQIGVPTPTAPQPVAIPGLPPTRSSVLAVSINNGATSPDGCALRIAGYNEVGVASAGRAVGFQSRPAPSLCGTTPATPLPDLVRVAPTGGDAGCWTTRKDEDGAAQPRFAGLRQKMLAAEAVLKKNTAFTTALEPVRYRTLLSAGPEADGGGRMHVAAFPERKQDGTRLWQGTTGCEVIPQVDRIGGGISQVSVFFNDNIRGSVLGAANTPPTRTGTNGGFPEYNGWTIITRAGRLPWVAQTLDDKLTAELKRRTDALAEHRRMVAGIKLPDEAAQLKTVELLRKSDPAGAEKFIATLREQREELLRQQRDVYPKQQAQLEKSVADVHAYRASFTAAQLAEPAVWADTTKQAQRTLDARINELQRLPTDDRSRTARQRHLESVQPQIADLRAQYDLTNLKPGPADQAISVKFDTAFFDHSTPNRVQLVMVLFSKWPDARQAARLAWQQQTKDTFDYAALAALLD